MADHHAAPVRFETRVTLKLGHYQPNDVLDKGVLLGVRIDVSDRQGSLQSAAASLEHGAFRRNRHREERSDVAIQRS